VLSDMNDCITLCICSHETSSLNLLNISVMCSLGVTWMNKIRNQHNRGITHMYGIGAKMSKARLRWFGQVQRRETEYNGRNTVDPKLPDKKQRGKPKRRLMGAERDEDGCFTVVTANRLKHLCYYILRYIEKILLFSMIEISVRFCSCHFTPILVLFMTSWFNYSNMCAKLIQKPSRFYV